MSGYTHGVRTSGQTVCTTLTSCDKIPKDATYVCHREFSDIASIILGESESIGQFIDDATFYRVVSKATDDEDSGYSFLKTMCVGLPTYHGSDSEGEYRDDYSHIPTVYDAPVSSKIC